MSIVLNTPRERQGKTQKEIKQKEEKVYFNTKDDYKDFYSLQQGVLIELLHQYCSITLKQQKKKVSVSCAYPQIISLDFGNEVLNVEEIADMLYRPVYEEERAKLSQTQTAMRRFGKNKKIFVQHLLIDILREKGFEFQSTLARNTGKTLRLERIEKVYYDGKLVMDFNEFIEKGQMINFVLSDLLDRHHSLLIPRGDEDVLASCQNITMI